MINFCCCISLGGGSLTDVLPLIPHVGNARLDRPQLSRTKGISSKRYSIYSRKLCPCILIITGKSLTFLWIQDKRLILTMEDLSKALHEVGT